MRWLDATRWLVSKKRFLYGMLIRVLGGIGRVGTLLVQPELSLPRYIDGWQLKRM